MSGSRNDSGHHGALTVYNIGSKYPNHRYENVSVVDKISYVLNTMLYMWENVDIIIVSAPMY